MTNGKQGRREIRFAAGPGDVGPYPRLRDLRRKGLAEPGHLRLGRRPATRRPTLSRAPEKPGNKLPGKFIIGQILPEKQFWGPTTPC